MERPEPDRKAPCPCGSGRRYKSCCQARDRALDAALDAATTSHRAMDAVMDEILTVLPSRGEHTIACKVGCNACCEYLITVSYAEALRIADHLLAPEQAALLARVEEALPRWLASVPEAGELDALTSRRDRHTEVEARRFDALRVTLELRNVLCPLIDDDGRCGTYQVRPAVCRAWAVADTAELCRRRPDGDLPPLIRHPAIDRTLDEVRDQMEEALRRTPGHGPGVLGVQVARALKDLRQQRR